MDSSEDRPEHSVLVSDGTRLEQWRRADGRLHRIDGPAYIEVRDDGSASTGWYREGKLYRGDGPAGVDVHPDGTRSERWYIDDQPHRADGPACVIVHPDGSRIEEWWIAGHQLKERSFIAAPAAANKEAPPGR